MVTTNSGYELLISLRDKLTAKIDTAAKAIQVQQNKIQAWKEHLAELESEIQGAEADLAANEAAADAERSTAE